MVVRKRPKSRKLRGRTRSMGWGRIGQHRKSGSRGGKGAAGMHKHKWTWVVKYHPDWFGKKGFKPVKSLSSEVSSINVGELEELVMELEAKGELERDPEGRVVVDLHSMGFNKLLGRGRVSRPLTVKVLEATETSISKIVKAGGKVVILGEGQG